MNSEKERIVFLCCHRVGFTQIMLAALHAIILFCLAPSAAPQTANAERSGKRSITVADVIGMTRVAGPANSSSFGGAAPTKGFASFSPDGTRFAIVLRRGNVADNTNEYSLFIMETDEIFRYVTPRLLLTLSSSSNRPGIKEVTWLRDNDTILFLGEKPGELTQLFKISCSRGKLKRLTDHPTNVTSYAVSENGERIVYGAETPAGNLATEGVVHYGFHVPPDVDLAELIAGHVLEGESDRCELFVLKEGNVKYQPLKVSGSLRFPTSYISISPNGRYVVVKTFLRDIDPGWTGYDDPTLKMILARDLPKGKVTLLQGYEVIDIDEKGSKKLVDAPVGYSGSELMWSSDSQSVILTGTHLPLNVPNKEEREARLAHTFAVEVGVPDMQIKEITDEDLRLAGFDQKLKLWKFESRHSPDATTGPPKNVYFRKGLAGWAKIDHVSGKDRQPEPAIFVDEDLNVPPRIVAENPQTKQRAVLFDLNPQFGGISLGDVEEIKWNDKAGHEITGALYLPPDYAPGKRYPLVIQTHGYRSHEFWIDGPYTTEFAAQPLASKEIAVLQLPAAAVGTTDEGERNLLAFESGIDYLDRKGVIDSSRVGLVGFSRTCYHVKYALTHAKFHFAAASVADGVDEGYFQFITFANRTPDVAVEARKLIGATPFGPGLQVWMTNSPGFLMDKVDTPIVVQAIGSGSLLGEWEWFSGLSQLGKAVDFVYLPMGEHILEKPWDRLASQQTTVDWFAFWLKGEEDSDPAKAEQYARWRKLSRGTRKN
jgi:dipeptidyl aminopeptidase/acylaminoacyl peptidase